MIILIPLVTLYAQGELYTLSSGYFPSWLIYLDLGIACLLLLPELIYFLFWRDSYKKTILFLYQKDSLQRRITVGVGFGFTLVGFVFLVSLLLTQMSYDMLVLSLNLILYGGSLLLYPYTLAV